MAESKMLGEMILFHRKIAKLSRLELAKLAGVGKTAIFDIEQGKETVRLSTLTKVLTVLNINIKFIGPLMDLFEKGRHEKS